MKVYFIGLFLIGSFAYGGNAEFFISDGSIESYVLDQIEDLLPSKIKQILKHMPLDVSEMANDELGLYEPKKHRITLSRTILGNVPLLTKTVVHEVFHAYDVTVRLTTTKDAKQLAEAVDGKSGFTFRLPDLYAGSSLKEYFAVNFENFLLDQTFQCRSPSLYRWFSVKFNASPFPNFQCEGGIPLIVRRDGKLSVIHIDPDRIYQVHYLLADRGTGAGRWGHSMIRLVMCNPKRVAVNVECLRDVSHHIVLSFVGSVDGLELDVLSGLLGRYELRLVAKPLTEILMQYNVVEQRNLISYPLKLSSDLVRMVLERAAEYQWGFGGNYNYLRRNCADGTLNLLASSLASQVHLPMNVLTPKGLGKKLIVVGLAEPVELRGDKLTVAIREGLYFQSAENSIRAAILVLRGEDALEVLPRKTLMGWYLKVSEDYADATLLKIGGIADIRRRLKALSSLLLAENWRSLQFQSQLRRRATKMLIRRKEARFKMAKEEVLKVISVNAGQVSFESKLAGGGYGIPFASEIATDMMNSSLRDLNRFYKPIYTEEATLRSLQLRIKSIENRKILIRTLLAGATEATR